MNNLIKAEMYKLRRNPAFLALLISVTGMSALFHFLILSDWWYMSGTPFYEMGLVELNGLSPFIIPLFFNLFVSTLAGYTIAIEFSRNGVIKNQILSGNKRSDIFLARFTVFSFGSIIIVVVIPLLTALLLVMIFDKDVIFTTSTLTFIVRSYSLFILQFLCFAGLVFIIAFVTGDSGRTILFTLFLSVGVFAIEKLVSLPMIQFLYEQTFFYQLSHAFHHSLSTGEIIKSFVIGVLSLFVILSCGIFLFTRKEFQ